MKKLDAELVSLLTRRVHDIAACVADYGVAVHLNGKKLAINSFADYVTLYRGVESPLYK